MIFTLLCACYYKNPDFEELDKINLLSETNPDSAYILFNQLEINDLTIDSYFRNKLLGIKIKSRLDIDIISDSTEIKRIKKHFLSSKSDSLIALSYFYAGIIYLENNQKDKAVKEFLKSLNYSVSINSIKAKAQENLAYIYYKSNLIELSMNMYKDAYNSYISYDKKKASSCIVSIGNSFQMLENYDSAIYYYEKSIELKKEIGDPINISLKLNLMFAYCRSEDYETVKKMALPLLNNSVIVNTNERKFLLYLNLSDAYYYTDMLDSATYFIHKAKELDIQNNANLMSMYHLWYMIEKDNKNYLQALQLHELYFNYEQERIKENNIKDIFEIQEKYNNEKLKNDNYQLIIKRQKSIIYSTFLYLFLLAILIGVFYKLQKTKSIKKQVESKFNFMNNMFESIENKTREYFIIQIDIVKKMTDLFKNKHKKYEKIKRDDALNSDLILKIVNRIEDKYHNEFKNKYPQLKNDEVIICYMILFDYKNFSMAVILNVSENTIQQKKVDIKNKIKGKKDEKFDIKEFIEEDFRKLDY